MVVVWRGVSATDSSIPLAFAVPPKANSSPSLNAVPPKVTATEDTATAMPVVTTVALRPLFWLLDSRSERREGNSENVIKKCSPEREIKDYFSHSSVINSLYPIKIGRAHV